MHRLFLFREPSALASGGEATAQPRSAADAPFALEAGAWLRLSLMVFEGLRRSDAAAQIAAATVFSDRALPDAWNGFVAAADDWDQGVCEALRTLADDIVSYANDIAPDLHGRLAALLEPLRDRAPSREEAQACVAILDSLAQAAEDRAWRVAKLGDCIGPFAEAADRFGEAFALHERNPAVRVVLPNLPGMCLSYGDDGLACAGDMELLDERQYWVLEPSGDAYVLMSAVDPVRVLVIDQDDRLIPQRRGPALFNVINQGPRPRVERQDRAPVNATRFLVSDLYIQNVNYPTLTLDCAGDDGQRQGAPILAYLKNGGSNQRWSFDPPPRSRQELSFYDLIAPVGDLSQDVGGLRRLQGDWMAIADDLRTGIHQILTCVELDQPLVARPEVAEVLDYWRRLAAEARYAWARLGRITFQIRTIG